MYKTGLSIYVKEELLNDFLTGKSNLPHTNRKNKLKLSF